MFLYLALLLPDMYLFPVWRQLYLFLVFLDSLWIIHWCHWSPWPRKYAQSCLNHASGDVELETWCWNFDQCQSTTHFQFPSRHLGFLVTRVPPVNTPFCNQPYSVKVTKVHSSTFHGSRDTGANVAWGVILPTHRPGGYIRDKVSFGEDTSPNPAGPTPTVRLLNGSCLAIDILV